MLAKHTIASICLAGMVCALLPPALSARTMYVTDSFEITVRTGPSTENKIITMITSNKEVEALEEQDGWIKIRLDDGREGYVFSRFLTSDTPNVLIVRGLKSTLTTLEGQVKELSETKKRLEASRTELQSTLTSRERELAKIKKEYETLKSGASNFVAVKNRNDVLQSENSKLKTQLKNVEQQNAWLKKWKDSLLFASGAGVLLFGWLLGFITGRIQIRRRRRMFYK